MNILKKQTAFSYDERIGKYPKDWKIKDIKKLAWLYAGGTPSTGEPSNWNGENIWLVPSDLTALGESVRYISNSETKLTDKGIKSCSTVKVPAGSVCLSSRATIGECAIAALDLYTNQGFINVHCKEELDNNYLLYWIKQNKNYISRYAAGTTFLEISRRTFGKLKMVHPEKTEQTAIATIITKVDDIIQILEKSIESAAKLKKALMQNLLTGKLKPDGTWRMESEYDYDAKFGKFPKGWICAKVKDVTKRVTDGEHLSPDFQENGSYLLSAEDVNEDGVSFLKAKYVKPEDCNVFRKRCDPEFGDVLIVSRGASIGRTCKVNTDVKFCLMGSVILIKPNNKVLHGGFLAQYFKSYQAWVELQKLSGTTAQQAIYLTHIKKVNLIYPKDTDEQELISAKLEAFDSDVVRRQTKVKILQRLKKSLMQNLYMGKVRVDVKKIEEILKEK